MFLNILRTYVNSIIYYENYYSGKQRNKKLLDSLKIHPREPYDSVIRRLIEYRTDDIPLSPETLKEIEEALKEIKKENCIPRSK